MYCTTRTVSEGRTCNTSSRPHRKWWNRMNKTCVRQMRYVHVAAVVVGGVCCELWYRYLFIFYFRSRIYHKLFMIYHVHLRPCCSTNHTLALQCNHRDNSKKHYFNMWIFVYRYVFVSRCLCSLSAPRRVLAVVRTCIGTQMHYFDRAFSSC